MTAGSHGAFHAIGIGSVIKLGQKEPRPIRTFTIRATLTRSVETKIGLSQRKKSFDPIPTRNWNTALIPPQMGLCVLGGGDPPSRTR